MSEHAKVIGAVVVAVVDLDTAVRAGWLAAGNPKAAIYLPAFTAPQPAYDPATQALVEVWAVTPNVEARRTWSIRPLTPDELRKTWTSYEFLTRFTDTERKRVWARAKQDDDVADFLMLAQSANEIISDDPVAIAGMDMLVSKNILTQARRDEILG